ncbi:MAG TPA: LicD family protein [Spirochaetota bacterium]|nr:LicD family protein [Spirochaetota bacterium]
MNREKAREVLFAVADALDRRGITFFIDYGTLLGAIRERDFIEHDNDIDLGIFDDLCANYGVLFDIARELWAKGIKLNAIWDGSAISFMADGVSVDLNRYVKIGDQYVISLYGKKSYYPEKFLDELDEIEFCGRMFKCPKYAHELMTLGYDDTWQTPVKDAKPNRLFKKDRHVAMIEADFMIPIFSNKWKLSVPKTAFFYWGESVMPYLRYKSIETFRRHNKDWTVKLYVPAKPHSGMTWSTHEQKVPIYAVDYSRELKHLDVEIIKFDFENIGVRNDIPEVYKSDFLRLFLLGAEGGLWSDMDILYFKPVEDMAVNCEENAKAEAFVSICDYGHSIGFMLSTLGSGYFSKLFDEAKNRFSQDNYQSIGACLYNKLFPTVESIRGAGVEAVNIPMDTVYAYHAGIIKDIYETGDMSRYTPGSIGLHWYAGHPLAGAAVNKVVDGMKGDNVLMKTLELAG